MCTSLWCCVPDISRTSSTQKQRGSLIDAVKAGETHDVIKVCWDGLQVDPPGIVPVLLHQVGQQELTHWVLLQDGGSGSVRLWRSSNKQVCIHSGSYSCMHVKEVACSESSIEKWQLISHQASPLVLLPANVMFRFTLTDRRLQWNSSSDFLYRTCFCSS